MVHDLASVGDNLLFSFSYGFELPSGFRFALVDDATGDGVADRIVMTEDKVIVGPGLGNGFGGDVETTIPVNQRDFAPVAFSAGDISGDGIRDLVVLSTDPPTQNGSSRGGLEAFRGTNGGALIRLGSANNIPPTARSIRLVEGAGSALPVVATSHGAGVLSLVEFTQTGFANAYSKYFLVNVQPARHYQRSGC